ncbi:alpha-ketoglutarate-dependent dioxygenase AlkB family protein [Lysobacter antibioticus]|uniref:alpha-ketoglutarate-dependent dioxygenase AlkB family protein n=1 Tax=Lysobacter antibioticus TaxID=84531 RepID=UPI00056620DE|nr:alpha-ketoglutarate-dependent dioxygenase AlkB [Lysobacter antibioticus]
MHQHSLFEADPQQPIRDAEGGVRYLPGIFDGEWSMRLFSALLEQAAWTSQQRMMYERLIDVPRRMAMYRLDRDALPPMLADTAERIGELLTTPFNSVGLNLYRDGRDSVALHNDKLHNLAQGRPIAVLSLGATRRMTVRAKRPPHATWQLQLESGSLVVMSHASQQHYDHGIPKAPGVVDPRISLAFRVRTD